MSNLNDVAAHTSLKEKNRLLAELSKNVPEAQRSVVEAIFFSSHADRLVENNYQNEGPCTGLALLQFLKAFYSAPIFIDGSNRRGGINFLAIYRAGDRLIPVGLRKDLILQPMKRLYVDQQFQLHLSTWQMDEDFIGVPCAESLQQFNLQNTNKIVFLTDL
jgi:hypothetical protein